LLVSLDKPAIFTCHLLQRFAMSSQETDTPVQLTVQSLLMSLQ